MRYAYLGDLGKAPVTSDISGSEAEVIAGAVVLMCFDDEWVLWWSADLPVKRGEDDLLSFLDNSYSIAKSLTEIANRPHVSTNDRGQVTIIGLSSAKTIQVMLGASSDQPLREWAKTRLDREVVERVFDVG